MCALVLVAASHRFEIPARGERRTYRQRRKKDTDSGGRRTEKEIFFLFYYTFLSCPAETYGVPLSDFINILLRSPTVWFMCARQPPVPANIVVLYSIRFVVLISLPRSFFHFLAFTVTLYCNAWKKKALFYIRHVVAPLLRNDIINIIIL